MALTLEKIAREVGVDVSLVSRVLSGDPGARISAAKRARILAIAAEHNYQPNRVARSLRARRTRILAMLNPDIVNPFYSHLFRSVERTASAAGYDVILCNTEESSSRFRHIVETLAEGHVDGLLIATAQETDPAIEWLRERKLPYMLLNRSRKSRSDPWVGPNDFQAGWLGGNHLGRLGHRRIALLASVQTHNTLTREAGFRAALAELGIEAVEELMVTDLPNRQSAKAIVASLMSLPPRRRPTAFFAPHTHLSDGMLLGIYKAGLRIPEDVSVVGCSVLLTPDITSVWLPIEEIGRVGTEYLLQKLRTANVAVDEEVPRIELPVALVDLGSTRAIAAGARA